MNPAIATQDQIDPGQRVITHIDSKKFAAGLAMKRGVLANQLGHNVAANVVGQRSFDQPHPVEVPARQIQNRTNSEIREELIEARPEDSGSENAGAWAGSRLGIS